jgi:3-oxoacyl-[acyl-carrier protein] reductase
MNVLITGASRGIGKSISKIFTDNNHQVYAPTRSELDLTRRPVLRETNFDIIINNAGINPLNSIDEIADNDVMQVNYLSPLEIIQQCLPHMIKQKYGRIINIGSIWIEIAKSKRLAYSASKSALHSLTKALTVEHGHTNILANTVSPGFIGTSLTFENNSEEEINNLIQKVPIGRLGYPEEIANIVYYLTVNNNFITGQNIIIDGGFSCTTN